MNNFSERLEELIGKPSAQRPFVCDGFPEECAVWVVGYNAATSGGDWWQYWSSETGFNLTSWRKDYDSERIARGKGPSATRRRIDRIKRALPNLLETNIFATPSTSMANMPAASTEAFDLLLDSLAPRVVIAHGVPAADHLSGWKDGELIKCPHLSRTGYAKVDSTIDEVQTYLS
jgi:hypothetical protein